MQTLLESGAHPSVCDPKYWKVSGFLARWEMGHGAAAQTATKTTRTGRSGVGSTAAPPRASPYTARYSLANTQRRNLNKNKSFRDTLVSKRLVIRDK